MQNINSIQQEHLYEGAEIEVVITGETVEGDPIVITENDIVGNAFSIDRNWVSGSNIEIGCSFTSELAFTLDNYSRKWDGLKWEGARLTVTLGIAGYPLQAGIFTVDEPPKKLSTITIRALDDMAKFNREYDTNLSYPATLQMILADACLKCGVTLDTISFTNDDYMVLEKPVEEALTYHSIIGWVAELAGCNAWIDEYAALHLSWYGENQTEEIYITSEERFSYNAAEEDLLISGIMYKTEETDYIIGTDDYALVIENNGLFQNNYEPVLNNLMVKIEGFAYRPYDFTILGYPHLWPGDIINIYKEERVHIYSDPVDFTEAEEILTDEDNEVDVPEDYPDPGEFFIGAEFALSAPLQEDYEYTLYINGDLEDNYFAAWLGSEYMLGYFIDGELFFTLDSPQESETVIIKAFYSSGHIDSIYLDSDYFPSIKEADSIITNHVFRLNQNSRIQAKGETKTIKGYATGTPFTPSQKRILQVIAEREASKQTSSIEQAVLKLNELMANSLGVYSTVIEDANGAKISYLHDQPTLEESRIIWTMTEQGLAWTDEGWEEPQPVWKYGVTADGSIIASIIDAGIVTADMIRSGLLQTQDGSAWIDLTNGYFKLGDIKFDQNGFRMVIGGKPLEDKLSDIESDIDNIELTPGPPGESQYLHVRYSVNANGNPMVATPTAGTKYIGIITTNNPTAPTGYGSYAWSRYVGEDGADGTDGADGQPTYTWVKYADTPTSGMSDSPDGKKYIGLAFNKATATESSAYGDYQWSLMPQNIPYEGRNLLLSSNTAELSEIETGSEDSDVEVLGKGLTWEAYQGLKWGDLL